MPGRFLLLLAAIFSLCFTILLRPAPRPTARHRQVQQQLYDMQKKSQTQLAIWLGGNGDPLAGCSGFCHAQRHANMWGNVVGPSGARNKQRSASDCCESCRNHSRSGANLTCNVWVFCPDDACGNEIGHCWLKYQPDPFKAPMVAGFGVSWNKLVPWTSGVIGSVSTVSIGRPLEIQGWRRRRVDIVTPLGSIPLILNHRSRNASDWLIALAATQPTCKGCDIYRMEPVPTNWGLHWEFGPPYAIIQGSFKVKGNRPVEFKPEDGRVLKRGMVIMMSGGDFLISLADHPEWGTSYTYLADVTTDGMHVVDLLMSKTSIQTVSWGTINASVPKKNIPIELSLQY